ncbi:MAG: putative Co/Zn/Cd cation transporter [Planctomycetota bacterium]|nr:putative Co/Zn/Cd cation transporter [Planctomycetota bacterium]
MTPEVANFSPGRRAALLSLVVGLAMLGGKWAAYLMTGSHAILSDALESIVHIAATGFALLSVILSERPPDPKYPYGYGKITYFSAGFEGGLIALAALAIFYEAVQGLILHEPLKRLGVGFVIILTASVVNLILGLWLIRLGKKTRSLILEADGKHVLADSYTSFGVVLGVALVGMTRIRWLDPLIAILVGVNILRTGYVLVQESIRGLMDRADPQLLQQIVAALQGVRHEGWLDVHQLRAWRAGDRTFVDFHLVVPGDWSVVRLHEAHDRARNILRETLGEPTDIIIHFDPEQARPPSKPPGSPWSLAEAVRVPKRDDSKHTDVGVQTDSRKSSLPSANL